MAFPVWTVFFSGKKQNKHQVLCKHNLKEEVLQNIYKGAFQVIKLDTAFWCNPIVLVQPPWLQVECGMMEVVQDFSKGNPCFCWFFLHLFSSLSLSLIGFLQRINYSGSLCFIEPFTVFNGFTQAEKKNMLGNHIILGAAHLPRLGATHNPQLSNKTNRTKREVDLQ